MSEGPGMELKHEALGHLRMARAAMIQGRDDWRKVTRELAVALTETDTAILWLQHDIQITTHPVNAESVPHD